MASDAIETGADLAELLVRIAPTVEPSIGPDLADCGGTVRDLHGTRVGNWTCMERRMPETRSVSEPAPTSSDTTHQAIRDVTWKVGHGTFVEPRPATANNNTKHLTVRDFNAHLSGGAHVCYVNLESDRIRIRHAWNINGQLQGKLVSCPGEWIEIPPDARVERLDWLATQLEVQSRSLSDVRAFAVLCALVCADGNVGAFIRDAPARLREPNADNLGWREQVQDLRSRETLLYD